MFDTQLLRLFASLAIMTIGATGMYAVNVSLKPILVEFDSSRAAASLPYAFTMVGFGLGGILMGRISDRVGVFWPVLFASFMLSAGFAAVSMVDTLETDWIVSIRLYQLTLSNLLLKAL